MARIEQFKYFDPLNLRKLRNMNLVARFLVEGFITGLHRSPHKGFSVEFAEYRQYVLGDDVRRIDWKVWPKTHKLYVKLRRRGYSEAKAARIAQSKTGRSLKTGRRPKRR